MLSLAMAVGGSVVFIYNWATNIYGYNRDAWMTDIQVTQNHAYQEENLSIAKYSMDREEVRDLMQSDINKINNSLIVTALIMSLAGEMLFEAQLPDNCAAFVLNAYMLCLGSAIFHLVLSITFGIKASAIAYHRSVKLLTKILRPGWKQTFGRMEERNAKERTKAFEDQPLKEMLVPPLASRLKRGIFSKPDVEYTPLDSVYESEGSEYYESNPCGRQPSLTGSYRHNSGYLSAFRRQKSAADAFLDGEPLREEHPLRESRRTGDPYSSCTSNPRQFTRVSAREQLPHRDSRSSLHSSGPPRGSMASEDSSAFEPEIESWHNDEWEQIEKEWGTLKTCMLKCAGFGTKSLIESCSYFCLSKLYGSYRNSWAFWAVQLIFTILNLVLMQFFEIIMLGSGEDAWPPFKLNKLLPPWLAKYLTRSVKRLTTVSADQLFICLAFGPMVCAIAATTPHVWIDCVCIPTCYMCHFVMTLGLLKKCPEVTEISSAEQDLWLHHTMSDSNGMLKGQRRDESSAPTQLESTLDLGESGKAQEFGRQTSEQTEHSDRPEDRRLSIQELAEEKSKEKIYNNVKLPVLMLRRGMQAQAILWFSALIWSFWLVFFGQGKGLYNEAALYTLDSGEPGMATTQPVPMHGVGPYFSPHALVCPKDMVFLADRFRVFNFTLSNNHLEAAEDMHKDCLEDPEDPQTSCNVVECDHNGSIADIATECPEDTDSCWPVLLLHGVPPVVHRCRPNISAEQRQRVLLQTDRAAERLSTLPGLNKIYATYGSEVIEYHWSARRKGYEPWWSVYNKRDGGGAGVLALDVEDSKLVMIKEGGLMEVQEIKQGKFCSTWAFPPELEVFGGGCALPGGDSVLILVSNGNHAAQLMNASMDIELGCEQPDAESSRGSESAHGGVAARMRGAGRAARSAIA